MTTRTDLDATLEAVADEIKNTSELGYVLAKLCDETIIDQLGDDGTIKSVIGVLESVKLDFYQRHAVPMTLEDLHGDH